MQYLLIQECYIEKFNERVNGILNNGYGWKLYGNPFMTGNNTAYCQALIKE